MKLLLSSLLLASFCALSSWSVSSAGESAVSQSHDVSVVEGETVEITCCWTLEYETVRVIWQKNKTELTRKQMIFKNYSYGSLQNKTSNCSQLTLMHVTRGDSGTYICRVIVEIPNLIEVLGNGTVLTVTAKNNTTGPKLPLITSLAVVSPLLLIALVCVCALQRRQVHATRVIYEVPHIDSEEVEMDKHSTSSSRGSSQWCQVPVYESFDYFERVETKESG
ncbi:uncharacterized protein LOC119221715 [Pungitius pungitius]|uniref:uncharacterized protein LOC119221715 n=1 Tax=Pungitius pungitius TaxID=134920 RepID=UPI002E0F5540